MADTNSEFSALLDRFSGLGKADRKAVLEGFSAEERAAFESAIAAEEEEQSAEEERQRKADRQFIGYSPWLGEIVENAVKGSETMLAPEAAKALAAEHKAITASEAVQPRSGWRGLIDRVTNTLDPAAQPAREQAQRQIK
ncbi:hypothetical protein [Qipengyuania sp. DGS5-3]|uniref:hypothetical protein n=1 Tax=Qipengyuania sp. DGS5-3 TaxID=3349632 RepID=UPI0036D38385